jgi:hypothetical protein
MTGTRFKPLSGRDGWLNLEVAGVSVLLMVAGFYPELKCFCLGGLGPERAERLCAKCPKLAVRPRRFFEEIRLAHSGASSVRSR